MVRMLNRYRTELGVAALPSELEATARRNDPAAAGGHGHGRRSRRRRSTASTLAFDVDVRNLTGHKFPTGYPSRRTWLHVTVRDGQDASVFESGAIDATARSRQRQRRRCRTASSRTTSEITAARPGADLRADPRRSHRCADDRTADGDAVPQGQPPAAARLRQGRRRRPRSASTATRAGDADFAGGGDRVALPRCRCIRRRAVLASRSSCAISRSATAGRTTSSATTRPSRSGSSRYYNAMSAASSVVVATARTLAVRPTPGRPTRFISRIDLPWPHCIRKSCTSRSCSPSSASRSAWCRCSADRRLPSPAAATLLLLAAVSSVVSVRSGTAAHGRWSARPARGRR